MKHFWITLLAVAVVLVIALPAGAVKPPKAPKPTTSAPIAVYLDADPVWVHEESDDVRYSVTIQNKTTAEVTVDISDYWDEPITLAPSAVLTDDDLFSYDVTEVDINTAANIIGGVTVSYKSGEVIARTSTVVDPVEPCDFSDLRGGEVCIWKPIQPGNWTVSVTPDTPVTRPTRLMVSVRDGVPGNWCTDPDIADSGVLFRRLLPGDTEFELQVLLPGSGAAALDGLADGQCYSGGAGGDYFAVGNPESFYLYTSFDGKATVAQP